MCYREEKKEIRESCSLPVPTMPGPFSLSRNKGRTLLCLVLLEPVIPSSITHLSVVVVLGITLKDKGIRS